MSGTATFIIYLILGTIVGISFSYFLVSWRLKRQLRQIPENKSYLQKKKVRIEWRQDKLQKSYPVFEQFIKENLQAIVDRKDFQLAAKNALNMKDSDELRPQNHG